MRMWHMELSLLLLLVVTALVRCLLRIRHCARSFISTPGQMRKLRLGQEG